MLKYNQICIIRSLFYMNIHKKLICLLCTFCAVVSLAYAGDIFGEIIGAQSTQIALATQQSQSVLPLENGKFAAQNIEEQFTIFVDIPQGASIQGEGWRISDNGKTAWFGGDETTSTVPRLTFISQNGTLNLSAFQDDNLNGQRGKYELNAAGILVEVYNQNQELIQSVETGLEDVELSLPAGIYSLHFNTQDKYLFTKMGKGGGRLNSATGPSENNISIIENVQVSANQTTFVSSAVAISSSIEGRIWLDSNNNGIMDEDEPAFTDIQITATGKAKHKSASAHIDENGYWKITQLPQDSYVIKATLPEDHLFAIYTLEGRDLRSIFTPFTGNSDSRDFYLKNAEQLKNVNIGVVKPGSARIQAFFDQNYNGILDEGEQGVAGIHVEFIRDTTDKSIAKGFTDENGNFFVPAIRQNSYRIRAILPADGTEFTIRGNGDVASNNHFNQLVGRRESSIPHIQINNNEETQIALGVARMLDFGGLVYIDKNFDGVYQRGEKLVPNVEVIAYRGEQEIFRTKTNNKGEYRITGLYSGNIRLEFAPVKDHMYVRRLDNNEENYITHAEKSKGFTDEIPLIMGENNTKVNAGIILEGNIQGKIFEDLNDNGFDDDNKGFENVAVNLLDTNQNLLLHTFTNADGLYEFEGILPGRYQLQYTLPQGAKFADSVDGGNTFVSEQNEYLGETFDFASGTKLQANLGGAYRLAHLEGIAFEDSNGNGVQDSGEKALQGVAIELSSQNAKQVPLKSSSDAKGNYVFNNLRPGDYALQITLPTGYIFSNDSNVAWANANSDVLSVTQSSLLENPVQHIPAVSPASIESSAWLDINKNARKDENDIAYADSQFVLLYNNEILGNYKSDAQGQITIANLRPGEYELALLLADGAESAEAIPETSIAGQRAISRKISVLSGSNIQDTGFGAVVYMQIEGKLWVDHKGEQKFAPEVAVSLYKGQEKIASTTTDENGAYAFGHLDAGDYTVKAQAIEGSVFVKPNDSSFSAQHNATAQMEGDIAVSAPITLHMPNSVEDINFISIVPAQIGDYVWLDSNQNGLQDAGEPPVENIHISIMQNGTEVYSGNSDGNGYYKIYNIYPGTYQIEVHLPDELNASMQNSTLPQISSILTQSEGDVAHSDIFTLYSADNRNDFDIGFTLKDGLRVEDYHFNSPSHQDWSRQTEKTNTHWQR